MKYAIEKGLSNNKLSLQFEKQPFIKLKRRLDKTFHNIIFTVYINRTPRKESFYNKLYNMKCMTE